MAKRIHIEGNNALAQLIDGVEVPFSGTFSSCLVKAGSGAVELTDVVVSNGLLTLADAVIEAANHGDPSLALLSGGPNGEAAVVMNLTVVETADITASIAANASSYAEGEALFFTITLNQPAISDLDFSYIVTGVDTDDVSQVAGTVSIATGELNGIIAITANEDSLTEGLETVTVTLSTENDIVISNNVASTDILDTSLTPIQLVEPTIQVSAEDDGSVIGTWDAVANAASLVFMYGETGGALTSVNLAGGITSYQTPILESGDYVFLLSAIGSDSSSVYSDSVELTVSVEAAIDDLVLLIDPSDASSVTFSGGDATAISDISDSANTVVGTGYTEGAINGVPALVSTTTASGLSLDGLAGELWGGDTLVFGVALQFSQLLNVADQDLLRFTTNGASGFNDPRFLTWLHSSSGTDSYLGYRAEDGVVALDSGNDTLANLMPNPHTDAITLQFVCSETGDELFINGSSVGIHTYANTKTHPTPVFNNLLFGSDGANGIAAAISRLEVLQGAISAQQITAQYTRLSAAIGII